MDREAAPRGHGIARVHREIQEDLLDLAFIGLHVGWLRRERDGELDILAQDAPEHLLDLSDLLLEIENLRLKDLAAAHGE